MIRKPERFESDVPTCDPARVHPYPGKWVMVESIEGGGKSALWQNIRPWLETEVAQRGIKLLKTYEPYDEGEIGDTGKDIRTILKSHTLTESGYQPTRVSAKTMQRLFVVARHDHVVGKVIPALGQGDFVWQERGHPSTFTYARASGLSFHWTDAVHRQILADQYYLPDLMIFLKISALVSYERTRKDKPTHGDQYSTLQKIQKLADAYDEAAIYFSPIAVVVDAEQPAEKVAEDVKQILTKEFF